jgi:hypothetical protein
MNIYRYAINSLRSTGILQGHETLSDYLKRRNVDELQIDIDSYVVNQGNRIKEYVVTSYLFGLSELFYAIIDRTKSGEIKFKSKLLREHIDKKIITYYSGQIRQFFQWDLDRRVWKQVDAKYKVSYIRTALAELAAELEGRSDNFVEKYFLLLIDYLEVHITNALSSPEFVQEISKYKFFKRNDPYMVFEVHSTFRNALINDSEENDFSIITAPYKIFAAKYLEGLTDVGGRYNNLFHSFITAQIDYKEYLESAVSALEKVEEPLYDTLRNLLEKNAFDEFIMNLKSLFASLPNEIVKNTNESYYHMIIHIVLKMIGVSIESEVSTNLGRIDSVLMTDSHITIIEFKMKDNNEALDQIKEKKYYEKYLSDKRAINLLGIVFSDKERNIIRYEVEEDIDKLDRR